MRGIEITDDGHAEVELAIDDDHAPLRRGTRAEIRQLSQSGLANRYVDLKPPPRSDDEIPDGGVIDTDKTVTQVDLDELYNMLDPETRRSLQDGKIFSLLRRGVAPLRSNPKGVEGNPPARDPVPGD